MRLLLNACFGREVERTLSKAGHDVAFAADLGLGEAQDPQVLGFASENGRVCVTLDAGFTRPEWPEEVVVESHPGIIVLRVTGQRMEAYGQVLLRFLASTSDQDFTGTIFVVRRNEYERRTRSETAWVELPLV